MPTYEFKNKDTGEVFEKIMSYEKKVKYLKDNPNIQSHYSTLNIDHDGGKYIHNYINNNILSKPA